jgi:hypothetical protein
MLSVVHMQRKETILVKTRERLWSLKKPQPFMCNGYSRGILAHRGNSKFT